MKKTISILLVILSIVGIFQPINSKVYAYQATEGGGGQIATDVPTSHYAAESINILIGKSIINGYPDGTFKPDDPVTVEAFIKITVSALGYTNLSQVGNHWANAYMQKAISLGLLSEGNINLNSHFSNRRTQFITRKEVAFILNRAAIIIQDGNIDYEASKAYIQSHIKDFINIEPNYRDAVINAYGLGLITGFPDETFKPNDILTRAQAAVCIYRLLYKEKRKLPIDDSVRDVMYSPNGGAWVKDEGVGSSPFAGTVLQHTFLTEDETSYLLEMYRNPDLMRQLYEIVVKEGSDAGLAFLVAYASRTAKVLATAVGGYLAGKIMNLGPSEAFFKEADEIDKASNYCRNGIWIESVQYPQMSHLGVNYYHKNYFHPWTSNYIWGPDRKGTGHFDLDLKLPPFYYSM